MNINILYLCIVKYILINSTNSGLSKPNIDVKFQLQSLLLSIACTAVPSRYRFLYIMEATVGSLAIISIESSYTY